MKYKKAFDTVSENLCYLLEKTMELEKNKTISVQHMVEIQSIKERAVSLSELILMISENENINKNYIAYELQVSQKFCLKSIATLNKIEKENS